MAKRWQSFNMNHYVRVKLTPSGHQQLRQQHENFYCSIRDQMNKNWVTPPYAAPVEDQEGWSKWQLWELMQKIGPSVGLGALPSIHLCEIQFEVKDN